MTLLITQNAIQLPYRVNMNVPAMKISVITPVYNAQTMIRDCMESVAAQGYQNKEHIIIDGLSSDNTVAVVNSCKRGVVKLVSEKDGGIYDAINKGIGLADGDVVCFLSADDMFAHENVLQCIAGAFQIHAQADMVYGDIIYVERNDLTKVVRYWKSSQFKPGLFKKGWMAPNTALFIRKEVFKKYGGFNLKLKMASDYELQFRFFEKYKLKSVYQPGIIVRMRTGGVSNSNWRSIYNSVSECYDALVYQNVRFPLIYIWNILFYRLKQIKIPADVKKINQEQANLFLQKLENSCSSPNP
jgi:glycosyltransferase involved in cell wall biosynthesis